MAFFKGTATEYQDFLDQLKSLVKDDHISVAGVYNGGTGYAVHDTITLAGGTKAHEPELKVLAVGSGDYITVAAVNAGGSGYAVGDSLVPTTGTYDVAPELEVLTESAGVVTSILIKNPGICSSQPTNPVATTSDGSGTGCTIDFTFAAGTGIVTSVHIADAGVYTTQATNPVSQNTTSGSGTGVKFTLTYLDTAWEVLIDFEAQEATAAVISAAGTGYTANDIVTVVGGSFTVATTVKILTVSGGVPQTVEVYTEAGEYSTTPSNPAATSGGTGTGLTLTMTWADATDERKYLMIHNTTSDQYIGWKGFKETVPETAYLLQCTGFTGFNSINTPWDEQPGATTALAINAGTYTPLSGGGSPATINYWLSVQDSRVVGVFRVASTYPNMYLGSVDAYLTVGEYAYPQLIMGCISTKLPYTYSGVPYAGMNNPGCNDADSPTYPGPGWLRTPDGSFKKVLNWEGTAQPFIFSDEVNVTPSGGANYTIPAAPNAWYNNSPSNWRELFRESTTISGTQYELLRVFDEFIFVPCTLVSKTYGRVYGNMRGVYCINPDAAVAPEDQIYVGSDIYRVFQNCNKTNRNYFFVLKEN